MSDANQRPVVLVVDDEPGILYGLELLLSDRFQVVTAPSAGEALGLVGLGLRPDVILADLDMPGLDGLDFRDRMPRRYRPRFVLMTGGVTRGRTAARIRTSGVPLLHKPQDLMHIDEVLMAVVDTAARFESLRRVA